MTLSGLCRTGLVTITRRIPMFRGLGRVVLLVDSCLTNSSDASSYMVSSEVNGSCRLRLDLRGWEQKFAFYYGRWEDTLISTVKRHFGEGAFYDVGASIGLYAMTFGRVCHERGSYLRAFEPVPDNLQRLREQFALNGPDEQHVA